MFRYPETGNLGNQWKEHTIYGNHRAFTGRRNLGLSYGIFEVGNELIYERQGEALLVSSFLRIIVSSKSEVNGWRCSGHQRRQQGRRKYFGKRKN